MYGTVRTVVWADGRGNPPSDPIPVEFNASRGWTSAAATHGMSGFSP